MPNMFNSILKGAGLNLADVRLLRHKDRKALQGRSPFELWRDDRQAFHQYQSLQNIAIRTRLNAPFWASFVVTPRERNMFVGIYRVKYLGLLAKDTQSPHNYLVDKAGSCDEYDLTLEKILSDYIGKLFVEWGLGYKAWVQRADKQDKSIVEIRK